MTYIVMWFIAVVLGTIGYKVGKMSFDFADALASAIISLGIGCLATIGFATLHWMDPFPILGLIWVLVCGVFSFMGLTLTIIVFIDELLTIRKEK